MLKVEKVKKVEKEELLKQTGGVKHIRLVELKVVKFQRELLQEQIGKEDLDSLLTALFVKNLKWG